MNDTLFGLHQSLYIKRYADPRWIITIEQWLWLSGRAVASDTRDPLFESSQWLTFIEHLFTFNCVEKIKNKEKEARKWHIFLHKTKRTIKGATIARWIQIASTILRSRVRISSTPSTLLPFIVKFVLYLTLCWEKVHIKQKSGRVSPIKNNREDPSIFVDVFNMASCSGEHCHDIPWRRHHWLGNHQQLYLSAQDIGICK